MAPDFPIPSDDGRVRRVLFSQEIPQSRVQRTLEKLAKSINSRLVAEIASVQGEPTRPPNKPLYRDCLPRKQLRY